MEEKENPEEEKELKLEVEHYSSFEDIYKNITKEGSLGVLALGAVGLKLWRKKRAGLESEKNNENG